MRAIAFVLVLSLAAVTFAVPAASATGCIVGNDRAACVVSVETRVCVTDPCDAIDVCVGHGLVCLL
jgi:hypothetical protein